MGDRANILVKESEKDSGVFLYTHWKGSTLPIVLKRALSKKWRWYDSPYLTRVIFDEMADGSHGEELGFGISSFCQDGRDRILELNCEEQTVSYKETIWSFQEYVDMSSDDISKIW